MLVHTPRDPAEQAKVAAAGAGGCSAFEAGLRHDLASMPVVSYERALGGWQKRAFDLVLTSALAPLWLPLLWGAMAVCALRGSRPAISFDDRVGYGGRHFRCASLRLAAAAPALEGGLIPANDAGLSRWEAVERLLAKLPQLLSVLRGEMSLVGPAPLTSEEVALLKGAKRHYLGARPGVVGIASLDEKGAGQASACKIYRRARSLSLDFLILRDALNAARSGTDGKT